MVKKNNADHCQGDEPKKRGRFVGTNLSPYEHQKILYLHSLCCVTTSKQCVPFEAHVAEYYSEVVFDFFYN